MSKFSRILSGTAVALTLMAGATQASAALITEWGYVVQSGFSAFAPAAPNQNAAPNDTTNNGVVGSAPNNDPGAGPIAGLPTVLSWGQGSGGPSQLFVTPTVSNPPNLFTNGPGVAGAMLTHANNTISGASTTLENAVLSTTLLLTPLNPAGPAIGPVPTIFSILFEETANAGIGGQCTPGTGGTPCADIFVLQDPGVLTFDFMLDDFIYTVALTAAGLGPLSDEACAAAGEAAGCIGFITEEGQNNELQTSFTITASPVTVAEPGTLALLGLGLLGLGIARRRKAA